MTNHHKTAEDYHRLAEVHGLRWLGPEVEKTILKTRRRSILYTN